MFMPLFLIEGAFIFNSSDYFSNQKRGGTTLRSNAYRLLVSREQAPRAQYPLTITYNSIVVRPPYKKTLRLPKNVSLHFTLKNLCST